MSKWSCGICGQIHESDEVGYNCPNNRKNSKYNRNNLTEFEKQMLRFYAGKAWRNTRTAVLNRDKYCQRCFQLYELYTYENLEAHHIHKLQLHWELRLDLDNIVLLCKTCHRQVDKQCKDGELDFNFKPTEIEYRLF